MSMDSVFTWQAWRKLGSAGDDGGYSHYPWDEDEFEDDSYGRKKIGENYYTLGDIFEESLKMTCVVDVEGNVLATDLDTKDDDIVQLDPFEGRDPDEDAYEGYTGNAGATSTHWYKNSVCPQQEDIFTPVLTLTGYCLGTK